MKKHIKISFNAPVVLSFAAVSTVALILNFITRGGANRFLFMTYRSSLLHPMTYIRFFTYIFGHSGWEHFIGNMSFILLLGPMLEEKYKSTNLVSVIVITALIPGVINYLIFPNVALLGASGVVFAFILLTSFTEFKEGEIPLTFLLIAFIFIGKEVYAGLTVQDNISNLSHIIGGIVGSAIGYKLNMRKERI